MTNSHGVHGVRVVSAAIKSLAVPTKNNIFGPGTGRGASVVREARYD